MPLEETARSIPSEAPVLIEIPAKVDEPGVATGSGGRVLKDQRTVGEITAWSFRIGRSPTQEHMVAVTLVAHVGSGVLEEGQLTTLRLDRGPHQQRLELNCNVVRIHRLQSGALLASLGTTDSPAPEDGPAA